MTSPASPALFQRHDGSITAYEILGNQDIDVEPIVLVAGLSMVRGDWERLAHPMSRYRKGTGLIQPLVWTSIIDLELSLDLRP